MTEIDAPDQARKCPYSYPFPRPSTLGVSELYEEIRETPGTAEVNLPSGDRAFIATRYDDVKTVLGDKRFSRAATLQPGAPRLGPAPQNFPTLLTDRFRMTFVVASNR
ncbi:hypothetical protein [Rhodococcus rhodnii]|uniref:hypothetical protein n=1 Tax=Rhodococcus rhodnii TaxID=38312 RepID=UPI0011C7CA89|nr:hypothetical protein [Rhodococcus rhodnii]